MNDRQDLSAGSGASDRFRATLRRGLVLLDAAMGTRLIDQGLRLDVDDPCLWNITHPDRVVAIHRDDVAAGADAVLTNTFGANRVWLARLGFEEIRSDPGVARINEVAVALARRAAGPEKFVIGSIGPTAADGSVVAEQAGVLIGAGVDALLFETHRLDQAEAALLQLDQDGRLHGLVPILVSLVAWPDPPGPAVERLIALGAEALGGNCQDGMTAALEMAERLRAATALPLIIKPAAGRPGGPIEGPEAFDHAVRRLHALAPVLVGGCCGTTDAQLAALRTAWYDAPLAGSGDHP